jgi:hypothetical protein
MKAQALAVIIAASLGVGSAALAQQTTARGSASAESQTSVSADRQGANVASENRAQGGVGAERAHEDGSGQQATADTAGASEMNATLERSVDARRAKPGDEVTAKTNESYTTASGMTIPRGSRLVGRVTEARAHARDEGAAASQLGIVFDRAELPDGRTVPMQATFQAVAAARSQAQGDLGSASHGADAFGSSHASGGGFAGGGLAGGGLGGGAIGGVGAAGGGVFGSAAGNAGAAVGGATRFLEWRRGGNGRRRCVGRLVGRGRGRLERVGPVARRQPRRVRHRRLGASVGLRRWRSRLADHVAVAQRQARRRHAALARRQRGEPLTLVTAARVGGLPATATPLSFA